MITDPIADFLTRIRNAARAGHSSVTVPHSKIKESIAAILSNEGVFGEIKVLRNEKFPMLKVYLLAKNKGITLTRKSKPGRRLYVGGGNLRLVKNGFGVGIISTSQGLLTVEQVNEKGLGGEYICEVY